MLEGSRSTGSDLTPPSYSDTRALGAHTRRIRDDREAPIMPPKCRAASISRCPEHFSAPSLCGMRVEP